jgi:hypothetical protein
MEAANTYQRWPTNRVCKYRMGLHIPRAETYRGCKSCLRYRLQIQIVPANTNRACKYRMCLRYRLQIQDGLNTLADGPPAGYQPSKHWASQIDLGSEIANECTSEGLKSSLHVLCTDRALLPYRCYALCKKGPKIDKTPQKIESPKGTDGLNHPQRAHAADCKKGLHPANLFSAVTPASV